MSQETAAETQVHFMKRPITLISTKHVDYENLTHLEAFAMGAAFILSVTAGVLSMHVAI